MIKKAVTLDELLDDWKENEKVMDKLFKVMAVDNCQIFPLWGNKFYMVDPEVVMNNCIYWFEKKQLYGFNYNKDKWFKVNIAVPDTWKEQIVKYYFYERD